MSSENENKAKEKKIVDLLLKRNNFDLFYNKQKIQSANNLTDLALLKDKRITPGRYVSLLTSYLNKKENTFGLTRKEKQALVELCKAKEETVLLLSQSNEHETLLAYLVDLIKKF